MTNAMPSLQMTIKLSYGWRPFAPPFLCFPVFVGLFLLLLLFPLFALLLLHKEEVAQSFHIHSVLSFSAVPGQGSSRRGRNLTGS